MKPNQQQQRKQQKWQLDDIDIPHENDILLGRGGASIHNNANVRYRAMVREHKKAYQTFTRHEKTKLAESLVTDWQVQNPPGRFLEKDDTTGYWCSIGEKSARRKTSQLLREGAPKIRRQLKVESDKKKKKRVVASTPLLPALAKHPSATHLRAVTPGALTLTTENRVVPRVPFYNNSRGSSDGGNGNANGTSTPLKQMTAAQVNNRAAPLQPTPYPYYHYPSSPQPWISYAPFASPAPPAAGRNSNKPAFVFTTPPPTRKPAAVATYTDSTRSFTVKPVRITTTNQVTPDTTHDKPPSSTFLGFSAPSPESPLEQELSTFQASWDFDGDILENCGDISCLVDEIEKEEEDTTTKNAATKVVLGTKMPLSESTPRAQLSPPRARLVRELSPPRLSPSSCWTTPNSSSSSSSSTNNKNDERSNLLMENAWASFSFSSLDSVGAGSNSTSFDMDGIVSPDCHSIEGASGSLPSAVDILDELDRELEAEFLLPLY